MRNRQEPLEKHKPHVIVGEITNPNLRQAAESLAASEGTEDDWRAGITVPRPRTWEERPELIGQTVVPHTCNANKHGDNPGCICDLIGKPVVIKKIYETPFVGTPSYHIKGSDKRIQEREFSEETLGEDPDMAKGFILENADGKFLTAGFTWKTAENPLDGYLHSVQVVNELMKSNLPSGQPTKAYPAESKYDGSQKKITGPAVDFSELTP